MENKQQFDKWDDLETCERLRKRWGSYDGFLDKTKKKTIFAALSELVVKFSKPVVLEVGCGCGHWLWQVHRMGALVVGQDYSGHMRRITVDEFAKRGVTIDVREGSCWDLPFGDDAVDVSFQIDVCMHVGGSWESIREMLRVSRKAILFTGPSFESWTDKMDFMLEDAKMCWGVSWILLEEELNKLKKDGGIAKFYYKQRLATYPGRNVVNKHRILVIEK